MRRTRHRDTDGVPFQVLRAACAQLCSGLPAAASARPQVSFFSRLLYLVVLLTAPGCQPTNLGTVVEPSFEHQLRLVTAGKSDLIDIASRPVTDDQLARLASANSLRILLIDSAEGQVTAAGLQHLTSLTNLEHFRCRSPRIDDAALAELVRIKGLKILNLPRAEFTDQGLAHLRELPNLVQLRFGSPHVTDAGIESLAKFPALTRLHLIDVPITDAALKTLASFDKLESLYLDGGHFSDAAIDEFFAERPHLHVHFNQAHHDRDPNRHP